MNFNNLFEEEEPEVLNRFSTQVIALVFYYAFAYYGLVKNQFKDELPPFYIVAGIVMLHVLQVAYLYKLHGDQSTNQLLYAFIVIVGPFFAYMLYQRYKSNVVETKIKQQNEYVQKMNAQFDAPAEAQNLVTPAENPYEQMVPKPPAEPEAFGQNSKSGFSAF